MDLATMSILFFIVCAMIKAIEIFESACRIQDEEFKRRNKNVKRH